MLVPRETSATASPSYETRRAHIAAQATGVATDPLTIAYTDDENTTWQQVQTLLRPLSEQYAAAPLLAARDALALPSTHIPQLAEVSQRLELLSGFRYASVAGTVTGAEFFGALASSIFPSTQFIRWSGSPMYTEQPDVLHEVGGHGVSLAHPTLAELHRLAGTAATSAPHLLTQIAAVFWYSIEFGVLRESSGWKAYGTGLLSSPGELGWFSAHAEIRPLNIDEMISTPFDISRFQPVLFGADSLDEVFDLVGGHFLELIRTHTPHSLHGARHVASQEG